MVEVLNRDVFDKLVSCNDVSFFNSSIYGIANNIFDNDYLLISIKNNENIKPLLLVKEKLKNSKYFHYMIYNPNYLSASKIFDEKEQKILKKFLKKNKCLYYTIESDGSESRNIRTVFYHLELGSNLIENFDLEVQSNINNSYKFPLNLIDVDIENVHHFCNIFSKINRDNLTKYIGEEDLQLKLVTLDIIEYIDNLTKQKNEMLLKKAEEKMLDGKYSDNIVEIEEKINKIDETIYTLRELQETKGDILYLAAGIYLKHGTDLIEYKTAQDNNFSEFNARYFMSFKMLKYALENKFTNYYNMNSDNILNLNKVVLYESKEKIVKKINYKLYKKRKDRKHD